jgi:hypothetical protein
MGYRCPILLGQHEKAPSENAWCFFVTSKFPPRPQKASEKKLRQENAWCFFAPSDFPPRPRAGIWKNRVKIASRKMEEAEAGRVDGSAVALSADGGYSGGRRWRHTGSRAPSAAHAAGAFLPRKASQEPDDLAHGRHRSGQIAW